MLHFQERGQNEFSLTGQLEAMFGEMMFEQVEFFDGFGHGHMFHEIERGIKPQEANLVKEFF
jgi:hypothetical protein